MRETSSIMLSLAQINHLLHTAMALFKQLFRTALSNHIKCFIEIRLSQKLFYWTKHREVLQNESKTSLHYILLVTLKAIFYLYLVIAFCRLHLANYCLQTDQLSFLFDYDLNISLLISLPFFQYSHALVVTSLFPLLILHLDVLFLFKVTSSGLQLTRCLVVENRQQLFKLNSNKLQVPSIQLTHPLVAVQAWIAFVRHIWSSTNLHFTPIKSHCLQLSGQLRAQLAVLSYGLDFIGCFVLTGCAIFEILLLIIINVSIHRYNVSNLIELTSFLDLIAILATLWLNASLNFFALQLILLATFTGRSHMYHLSRQLVTTESGLLKHRPHRWRQAILDHLLLSTYRQSHNYLLQAYTSLDRQFIARTSLFFFLLAESLNSLSIALLIYHQAGGVMENIRLYLTTATTSLHLVLVSTALIRASSSLSSGWSGAFYRAQFGTCRRSSCLSRKLKLLSTYELINSNTPFRFHVGSLREYSWYSCFEFLITSSGYLMYICKVIKKF